MIIPWISTSSMPARSIVIRFPLLCIQAKLSGVGSIFVTEGASHPTLAQRVLFRNRSHKDKPDTSIIGRTVFNILNYLTKNLELLTAPPHIIYSKTIERPPHRNLHLPIVTFAPYYDVPVMPLWLDILLCRP